MPNRTVQPPVKDIVSLTLPHPVLHHLDNGVVLYESNMGTQKILKLELVFFAGRPFEDKTLISRPTSRLLKEGTLHRTSAEIAEIVDFYGGTLSMPYNLDTSNVVLYSLNKHFEKLLPLIAEIITEPAFAEKELTTFKENSKQSLQVDLTKNDVVAYREITELIFGSDHPYGYNSLPESYTSIHREDLLRHFKKNYDLGNCIVFISGKTNAGVIDLLNKHLGQIKTNTTRRIVNPDYTYKPPQVIKYERPNTVQTAIRIGRRMFNKTHKDFKGFYVLNTILGGYFGSRLMMNIREEKGYTYNIYSSLDSMLYDGYFYVATEVGNEFVDKTLEEIYTEFERLKTDLVKEDEMEMVRNYLMGTMMSMLDGPFNIAEVVKTMTIENLHYDDFEDLVRTITTISPEDLRSLAQKYLNKEDMFQVIVGV